MVVAYQFILAALLLHSSIATSSFEAGHDCVPEDDSDDASLLGVRHGKGKYPAAAGPKCINKPPPSTCPFQTTDEERLSEDEIFVTTVFKVAKGSCKHFKHAMTDFLTRVKANENGTWAFTVWVSKDCRYGSTFEQYANGNAAFGLRPEIAAFTKHYQTWLILGNANEQTRIRYQFYYPRFTTLIAGYRNGRNLPNFDFTKQGNIINIVRADIFNLTIFDEFAPLCGALGQGASIYGIYQSEDQKYNGFVEVYPNDQGATDQLQCGLAECIMNQEKKNSNPACEATDSCGNGMQPVATVPKVYMGHPGYFASQYDIPHSGGGFFGEQPYTYALPESFIRC